MPIVTAILGKQRQVDANGNLVFVACDLPKTTDDSEVIANEGFKDAGQKSASEKFGASSPLWWQGGDDGKLSSCRSFFLSPSILGNDSVLCRLKQLVLPA